MFGKLEDTARINTSGVGLGLSICKKIVEALDGDIYLEENANEEQVGSTFVVKINLEESDREALTPSSNWIKENSKNIFDSEVEC